MKTMRSDGPARRTSTCALSTDPARETENDGGRELQVESSREEVGGCGAARGDADHEVRVALQTLMGSRIAASMAGIFSTPLPIPNSAERMPTSTTVDVIDVGAAAMLSEAGFSMVSATAGCVRPSVSSVAIAATMMRAVVLFFTSRPPLDLRRIWWHPCAHYVFW